MSILHLISIPNFYFQDLIFISVPILVPLLCAELHIQIDENLK